MKKIMHEIPNELDTADMSTGAQWLCRNIDIYFNGVKQTMVAHYNIKEGWIAKLRISGYGRFRRITRFGAKYGKVEVKYKDGVGNN